MIGLECPAAVAACKKVSSSCLKFVACLKTCFHASNLRTASKGTRCIRRDNEFRFGWLFCIRAARRKIPASIWLHVSLSFVSLWLRSLIDTLRSIPEWFVGFYALFIRANARPGGTRWPRLCPLVVYLSRLCFRYMMTRKGHRLKYQKKCEFSPLSFFGFS
jgi:hypothetical protein